MLAILVKDNFYRSVFDEILQCAFNFSFPFFTDTDHDGTGIRRNRVRNSSWLGR